MITDRNMKHRHSSHNWRNDPMMKRWRYGRFLLPKPNPAIEIWHWPVVWIGVN